MGYQYTYIHHVMLKSRQFIFLLHENIQNPFVSFLETFSFQFSFLKWDLSLNLELSTG